MKVICHMLTSMNGKIDDSYMSKKECCLALQAYNQIRNDYHAQAVVYAWTTMKEGYVKMKIRIISRHYPFS